MTTKRKRKVKEGGIPEEVDAVFRAYPPLLRTRLMQLRKLILATARKMDGVGELEETLRWGQPSFISKSKSGSTIRIDGVKNEPARYALYFICHTDLIARFRELYPELEYGGSRSILLDTRKPIPEDALRHCVALALTYHLR
ncbi:MAG TPA: DUF1801 domain-containing protein [Rhizomicrobium sp.]|nr:DUF1801 domain-containing protein [Rhizomicrobium sp.]